MLHFRYYVVLLFLFRSAIANNIKQTFEARFDAEKWLKTYELVNITADFDSSEQKRDEHRHTGL